MTRIAAIVVLFQPDLARLARVLDSLVEQVDTILCVDNGSPAGLDNLLARHAGSRVRHEAMGGNRGIGAAHNQGILRAREYGCTHVLLCDQDSIPAPHMVAELLKAEAAALSSGARVAAVGPRYRLESEGGLSSFNTFGWIAFGRRGCAPGEVAVPCDFLIASGCLIRLDTIDAVGLMAEGLFIDHVDTEWCLRARSLGYRPFGACAAQMSHTLGERIVHFNWPRRRTVALHKPFRYYYIFRNSLKIYRLPHAAPRWVLPDIIRLLQLLLFVTLFSNERSLSLRMMLRGLSDGLGNAEGVLELSSNTTPGDGDEKLPP